MDGADSPLVGTIRPSPNHGPRAGDRRPDSLILHYTGMPDGPGAVDWLCDPASSVSCHYVVDEGGHILQLVAEDRRAWHAGRSSWAGETDMNSASIGIEIVNPGHSGGLPPFPVAQIEALIPLCRDIVARHAIRPDHVLGHSDIAPGRKEDPGERFPWQRVHAEGVGLWVPAHDTESDDVLALDAQGERVMALQVALADYGYGIAATGAYDAATHTVVRAFQRHFRPARIDGRADAGTVRTLHDLLAARDRGNALLPQAGEGGRQAG